jgi:hypothetical protein
MLWSQLCRQWEKKFPEERGRRLHAQFNVLARSVCSSVQRLLSLSSICKETGSYQSLPPSKREQRADIKVLGSASLVRFSVKRI